MKILIVDDSKDFRALASSFLTRELEDVEPIEYEVEELERPADDFLLSDYDVLLLDYNLGGGENGFDWLEEFGRKTGQGAMSEVYLAERIGDYQSLVLKVTAVPLTL